MSPITLAVPLRALITRSVVATLVLVSACDDGPTAPTVPLASEFVLAPGEEVRVAGTSLSVRFIGVIGDSRCPADAVCILGGDAIVRIEAQTGSGSVAPYDLHTGDERPVAHDGFTVRLVQLVPYPFSSRPIEAHEYRATLHVAHTASR